MLLGAQWVLIGSEALFLWPPQLSPEIRDPILDPGDLQLCCPFLPPSVTPDRCLPLHRLPRGDSRPGLVHGPQSVQVRNCGGVSQLKDGPPDSAICPALTTPTRQPRGPFENTARERHCLFQHMHVDCSCHSQ